MDLIFQSSLPRSGSTLLQNILAQDPSFYCSATSGLIELLFSARASFTSADEFKLRSPGYFNEAWRGFCRGAATGFYEGLTDKPFVVDKSRGWLYYYDWLKQFWPDPKVIVCVRDLRGIVASMEKMHRKNAHLNDPADSPAKMNFVTVDQRVSHWMSSPPVGLSLNRLADSFHKGNARNFLFVRFEDLTEAPKATLDRIYDYLEIPSVPHDFDNVDNVVAENDGVHGVYGDHATRMKVAPVAPDWDKVLGPQICSAIVDRNKWFYDAFYRPGTGL